MKNKLNIKKYGFTLIELLVVMSIIVVLTGLSAFGLQGARESGRDGRRKADLENIRSALEMYRSDCGKYPINTTGGDFYSLFGSSGFTDADGSGTACGSGTRIYIESGRVPKDPSTGRNYMYITNTSGTPGTRFWLCAGLETEPSADSNCSQFSNCGTGVTCSYYAGI